MRATKAFVEQALAREGLQPNKNLGQHFCVDGAALQRLAGALPLTGRTVLEIGPGLGGLTELLLAAGARVYAVEKDPRLCDFLRSLGYSRTMLTRLKLDGGLTVNGREV